MRPIDGEGGPSIAETATHKTGPHHKDQVTTDRSGSTSDLAHEALAIRELRASVLSSTDIGANAIEYAVNNWAVFPLRGKVPAIAGGRGVLDATTDIGQIVAWWSGPYRGANVGCRVPDSMVVIDVDPRHDGDRSIDALEQRHGKLPETLTTISGRGDGGRHLFFRCPTGKLTGKRLGPGIDLKTSAGYVVMPPSIHPDTGKPYTRIEGPVAAPPAWLVGLLRPEQSAPAPRSPRRHLYALHGGPSIADEFTVKASWATILELHGWRCPRRRSRCRRCPLAAPLRDVVVFGHDPQRLPVRVLAEYPVRDHRAGRPARLHQVPRLRRPRPRRRPQRGSQSTTHRSRAMINADDVDPMPDEPEPDHDFWTQRDILTHIHRFARSRSVAPYPVLGCVLRRAISCVEPHVKLPPIIGGTVSVNLFTISAGRSGQGKDASDATGFAAVHFPDAVANDLDADRPNIGSGEGLARLFKGHKGETALTRAHLIVPEVATLAALAGRQGATLSGEILKAYMGQALGFNNAQKDTTTAVEAHSYRLCLGVGVQPENADFFLAREKDGFPQRFLWSPTIDPYASEDRPAPVAPVDVVIPDFGFSEYLVGVPDPVIAEILAHRHQVLIGSEDVDPLDGHLMLIRLKVAFGLALLDGRKNIDAYDWKIGGDLLDVSRRVRDDMRWVIDDRRRRENTARAHDQADRDAIIAVRLAEESQKRVAQAITRKLRRVATAKRVDLRRACDVSIRGDFDPVFDLFLDKGFIVCCEGRDGRADEYELAPEGV